MDYIIELAKEINIAQLIAMGIIFWFFYGRLDNKIEKGFDKMDKRFEKLENKVEDVDRRLCRLEGAFSSKDCCMFKDERQMKKAE